MEYIGQNDKFNVIYETYHKRIFLHLNRKINNRSDAEDLTEEVFVRCYRNLASFDEAKSSIGTWLYVIANNLWKNYLRDKRVHSSIDDYEDVFTAKEMTDASIMAEERRKAVERVMSLLDEKERAIVVMTFYHGMKSNAIGKKMGMSDAGVRMKKRRALSKMRKFLEKEHWSGEWG
ncbi:MAG: sigma-70 family RNA polymerase sigma factor [Lachnospiraceae bacterium]|nr:sigma-70 family RNA polymerase sigma factor [Lachnospiraceae bacterium]